MEKLIYKVTKPYIYEGLAALAIDELLGWGFYLISILSTHNYLLPLVFPAVITLVGLVLDAPLLIKCLIDRKTETVIEEICTLEDALEDSSYSNKFALSQQSPSSILTTSYYPREWNMHRHKLILRTIEGKRIKLRIIQSWHHGQLGFMIDLCGIQRGIKQNGGNQMRFVVQYCKYSKALLSMRMISCPPDMKKRTKEYIDSNLRDILRWSIKC